jgi:hypothetical protein
MGRTPRREPLPLLRLAGPAQGAEGGRAAGAPRWGAPPASSARPPPPQTLQLRGDLELGALEEEEATGEGGDGCGVDLPAWSSLQVNTRLRRGSVSPGPACARPRAGRGDGGRRHRRQRGWAEEPLQGAVAAWVAAAALHRRWRTAATVPAESRDNARSRICSLRLEKAARRGRRRQQTGAGEGS